MSHKRRTHRKHYRSHGAEDSRITGKKTQKRLSYRTTKKELEVLKAQSSTWNDNKTLHPKVTKKNEVGRYLTSGKGIGHLGDTTNSATGR